MQALPGGRPGPDVIARGGNNTWAPDVIRSGSTYFLYYSAPGTQPKSAIGLLVGKTLDPESPDYNWEDGGPVVWSDGIEDSNAIDPGVFRDPTNGSLWLTYGSYFGYIRLVELNPKTGQRLYPATKPVNIAINSEASIMIFRDGWYYLLVTHGSCCAGANSSYNIRMGRAKRVTGPFVDNMGIDMLQGGGKLFVGSQGRHVGPGHFGLLDLGDGVQKFSCTTKPTSIAAASACSTSVRCSGATAGRRPATTSRPAPIRSSRRARAPPSSWPCRAYRSAGARTRRSRRAWRGGGRGGGRGDGRGRRADTRAGRDASVHDLARRRNRRAHVAVLLLQAQQKWTMTPVANAGGYPGSPYFKITIAGTERTLAATPDDELTVVPAFSGGPEQLWRIDQLTDGTYRVMPKATPDSKEPLALSAVGSSMPTLARFHPDSDRQRWLFKTP